MKTSNQPLFRDTMDSNRVVQPRKEKDKVQVCGIFWKTKNGLVYGGEAEVPSNLFCFETDPKFQGRLGHIGFVPYTARGVE